MSELSRRAFLGRSGVAAGGIALTGLAGCEQSDGSDAGPGSTAGEVADPAADFDPGDWDSVRDQFPLTHDIRHFAAFVLASHPRPVADAIERHRRGLDEDAHGYLQAQEADAERGVLDAAADYLGADPDEIALTDSTTMGLGLLYGGLRLTPGQEVLATEHDFYSTHESLRLRSARTGAAFRRVRLYDDPGAASVDEIVGRLVAAVTPASRVVAITWVHSSTGVKLPVRPIADALRDANAGRSDEDRVLLCVDGVHGLGAEDATIGDLGCDFLVSGTHKWLFGPRGTGILWGRRDAWAALDPIIPPFERDSIEAWLTGGTPATRGGRSATPGGYHSFEHRWGLAEAFRFHLDIGKDRVARRTHEQAVQLKAGLADAGRTVVTPMDSGLSAGIVCIDTPGEDQGQVLARLAEEGIAGSLTPYRESYLRFGPSIVTTPDDVDALIEALRP